MALPTQNDLLEMDISYRGEPFVWGNVTMTDLAEMDISYRGEPFVVNVRSVIKVNRVSWWYVNKFLGVNSENINKLAGVSTD